MRAFVDYRAKVRRGYEGTAFVLMVTPILYSAGGNDPDMADMVHSLVFD